MKDIFRLFAVTLLLLGLSACAVLDVSTMDSAIPLKAGKTRISAHQTVGLDIASMTYINQDVEENSDLYATPVPVTGMSLSHGIDGDNEFGGSAWLSAFNLGGRIYFKHLAFKDGNKYISLIPAITYVKILEEYEASFDRRHEAVGSELQLLYSYKAGKSSCFTAVLRVNYNRYTETIIRDVGADFVHGPYDIVNYGIRGNLKLSVGPVFAIPEIGVECVPVVNGKLTFLPVTGLALGLEF